MKKNQTRLKKKLKELEDDNLKLTINFREATSRLDHMKEQIDCMKEQIEKLKDDKNCRDVVFMLKDFQEIKTIATKIQKGSTGVHRFTLSEILTLKYRLHKRRVGNGIQGLLASQNIHGRVTSSAIEHCKRLASQSNVFEHFNVKGKTEEIIEFAKTTEPALKVVEQYLGYYPHFGSNVHMKYGHGQISFKGHHRAGGQQKAERQAV